MGAQNVSAERVRKLPLHGLLVDNPVARALRHALVPKSVRTRIRMARTPKERPTLPAGLRAQLEDRFAPDRAALAQLFPDHPALPLCYGFTETMSIGAVIIGRNEGARLLRCLASVRAAHPVIYVDSGSTDGSVQAARDAGAEVVLLDTDQPFTAARARNAGLAALAGRADLVQLIDGDCELRDGWLARAADFLADHPDVAVVCGRRRERFPEASVYNRLTDCEWDTPRGAGAVLWWRCADAGGRAGRRSGGTTPP